MSGPSPLWRGGAPLLLASTSPTRAALLASAGLPFEAEAPGVDERAVEAALPGASPRALAEALAREKALAASRRHPERLTVGADQTLDLDGTALHKPSGPQEAAEHLRRLSGRTHALHSAVALARGGEVADAFVATARLAVRELSAGFVEAYLAAAGEAVTRSVGAYQVEGLGAHLFERIDGEHATVLGLPLMPLLARLRGMGLIAA